MNKRLFFPDNRVKVAIVAGEASGDLLGAHLMDALCRRGLAMQFVGIGGPRMVARGCVSVVPQERLALRGYTEVIRHLPALLRIRRELRDQLLAERPDIYIGIDAPDFNLALEAKLKQAGIPTVHYVSPAVWAWRCDRINKIGRAVNHLLCLFPMEPPLYAHANVAVTYVGHPLANEIPLEPDKDAMRMQLGFRQQVPLFALLPGSRSSELAYMGPLLIKTARKLLTNFPDAQFVVPLATRATMEQFDRLLTQLKGWQLPIRKLFGHTQMALIASDVVLVTSGTATLEVALAKRPMVISYKVSPLTYYMVKRKFRLPYIGLPNILIGRKIVPELLQQHATPDKLAEEVTRLYHDKVYQHELKEIFTTMHLTLKLDTADLAADVILKLLR